MKNSFCGYFMFFFLILNIAPTESFAQRKDTIFTEPYTRVWYRQNPYKALLAPTILVGLGVATIGNPVYDRHDMRRDVFTAFPGFRRTRIDDFLVFAPYAGLLALNISKIPCENDFINTGLLMVKAQVLTLAMVYSLKGITGVVRPDGSNPHAFPSGHTAVAFMAASLVNREFRYRTPWIGIASYGIATSVGMFRILNDKHWMSDVLAGAGIGILATNIAYITHRWRWGRPGSCMVPFYQNGAAGVMMNLTF